MMDLKMDSILILGILIFISCRNTTVNTYQINSTLGNIECYKSLLDSLNHNHDSRSAILKLRDSKTKGRSDLLTVNQQQRLIEFEELKSIISSDWLKGCGKMLSEDNDFRGVRYVSENLLIIEVDKFAVHSLSEQYSSTNTVEIHRLIIGDLKFIDSKFRFNREVLVYREELGGEWVYEVTQIDTP